MTHEQSPLIPETDERTGTRHHSSRRSVALEFQQIFDAPSHIQRLRSDSAWALKLKEAVDAAGRELHVQVWAAVPVYAYETEDPNDMRFELETDQGRLEVIRTRSGHMDFRWI